MGPGVRFQRADVLPVALRDAPVEHGPFAGQQTGEDVGGKVHDAFADVIEDPRLQDVNARIDRVGEDLSP